MKRHETSYGHQLEALWAKYHSDNPQVWRGIKSFADRIRKRRPDEGGCSMSYIIETLRYFAPRYLPGADGERPVSMPNAWQAYYARLYNLHIGYNWFRTCKLITYDKPARDDAGGIYLQAPAGFEEAPLLDRLSELL